MNDESLVTPVGLENPRIQSVIEIAEEILDKNQVLNIDILYKTVKRRLKIPHKQLYTIIQHLVTKKILVEGSKLTKDSVLLNTYRNRLNKFIRSNPGAHFSLIRKEIYSDNECRIGSAGQLIWHLEILIKFNYIKKIKVNNYSVFLQYEIEDDFGAFYFILREEINSKIIGLILKENNLTTSEIYNILSMPRAKIYYHIKILKEWNLIVQMEEGIISLNPNLKNKIYKIMKDLKKSG